MELAQDVIDAFRRDGAVVVRGVVPPDAVAALSRGVEENMAAPSGWANDYTPAGRAGRFFGDYVSWQRIDAFRVAALAGPLPQLARELMGSSAARFFHEHVLVKEPGTDEVTPWHHDDPYYCVDGMQNVSLWAPLDPVPEVAAVKLVAGSHRWGRRFVPRRFVDAAPYAAADAGFELVPDIDAQRGELRILRWSMEAGDVLAFHFRTLHGAPGTSGSPHRRRVVSFRYVGDDAVFATRPWVHSPPFDPIAPGEPLDDDRFPIAATALSSGGG